MKKKYDTYFKKDDSTNNKRSSAFLLGQNFGRTPYRKSWATFFNFMCFPQLRKHFSQLRKQKKIESHFSSWKTVKVTYQRRLVQNNYMCV